MRKAKKLCSIFLVLLMIVSMLPEVEKSVLAQAVFAYNCELTGNTGAIITVTSGQAISAAVNDTSIATASVSGSVVNVKGVTGAVGIAKVTIKSGNTIVGTVEVPVGYTTFIFNDDDLYVYEGSAATYEVYGINKSSADDIAVI